MHFNADDANRRTPLPISLKRRWPTTVLACLLVPVGSAIGAVGIYFWTPLTLEGPFADRAEGAFLLLVFLSLAYFTIVFPTAAYRVRFYEQGVWQLSWRGPRFVPWSRVRRASFDSVKGHLSLNLFFGRLSFVRVPLDDYRLSATLYREIVRRVPVAPDCADIFAQRLEDAK